MSRPHFMLKPHTYTRDYGSGGSSADEEMVMFFLPSKGGQLYIVCLVGVV